MMTRAIASSPIADEAIMARMWIRARWKGESAPLTDSELSRYVGDYGPRHIILLQGQLSYYRGSNTPSELIPVGENQFMIRGIDYFKIEFVMGASGQPEKIVGHYSDGRHDESMRNKDKVN